jgi:hypothetical protein
MQYSSLVFDTKTSNVHGKYKLVSHYGPTNPFPASDRRSAFLGTNLRQGVQKEINNDLNFWESKKEK